MKQNTVGHTTLHETQYNKTHNSLGHHKKPLSIHRIPTMSEFYLRTMTVSFV